MNVGDWVQYTWNERVYGASGGYKDVPHRAYAKVAALADEKGRVTLESWEMAKITHRTKAFGQRIDKTPYRVGGTFKMDAADIKSVMPSMARMLEAANERLMRYPTRAQRDYARAKRRREAAKR